MSFLFLIALTFGRKMTVRQVTLLFMLNIGFSTCGPLANKAEMQKHTNQLITETSPYLLQHAHNPVNWHAWNVNNINEAKKLDKPLLISIGYSSCHWCHVMEHESFEDEEIAQYMNEYFYCIKVDREERPDVDAIYMTAANIITGSGGWPLNCFALPDGRPFHAGTYYPKEGWLKLLQTVNLQYSNNKQKLEDYATRLTQGIRMQETAISDNKSSKLDFAAVEQGVGSWKNNWDMLEGGITKAPKFPMPSNLNFLLHYQYISKDKQANDFINLTLYKMAFGGIFDQIGGGFSRYSTDALWKAPHFEKMLYDNGQLLSVYSKAYKRTNDAEFNDVISKTIDWLQEEMTDESGLFYSALDADSEGEEGKYYVWSSAELEEVLSTDFDFAANYYNINSKALWEHGNNILLRNKSNIEVARTQNMSIDQVNTRINIINSKLLKVRKKRIKPGLDDKCLTSWNALTITGLCNAYKATGNDNAMQMATKCLDAIIKHQFSDKGLKHSYKNGISSINGMLEDYVFTALAAISAFEITGNKKYLDVAKSLTTEAIKRFYDIEKEIFYFNEQNELILRTSEIYDNVIPSTNSAMAHLLQYIGLAYGNSNMLQISDNLIGKVQQNFDSYFGGHSNWASAHLKSSTPFFEVVIIGKQAKEYAKELNKLHLPNTWIIFSPTESKIPVFNNRFKAKETLIYVCVKGACSVPSKSVNQALKQINDGR